MASIAKAAGALAIAAASLVGLPDTAEAKSCMKGYAPRLAWVVCRYAPWEDNRHRALAVLNVGALAPGPFVGSGDQSTVVLSDVAWAMGVRVVGVRVG